MAPRKRQRVSHATSPSAALKTPEPEAEEFDVLNDPWTDEEETGLFKGLIKWKPTGIHKHFRMLQLRDYLLENKFIHARSQHTQIPGIWEKLRSLYDLDALDQREDSRQLSEAEDEDEEDEEAEDDVYSEAANKVHKQSFELPDDEYNDMIWQRRLADEQQNGDESPPTLPELNLAEQAPIPFTPSFSLETASANNTSRPRGRPKGSTKTKAASSTTTRRSRRGADAEEPSSEAAEDEPADDDEDDEDEEEEVVDEDADEGDSTSKGRGGRRSRGGTAKRRGRPRGK